MALELRVAFSAFMICFAISTTFTVLRAYVKKCEGTYWTFMAMNFVIGTIAIIINDLLLQRSYRRKETNILMGTKDRSKFNSIGKRLKYTVLGLLAGMLAAAMGVGGAIISTPMMIGMGVSPYIARVNSAVMIFFTSLTSSVQYASIK